MTRLSKSVLVIVGVFLLSAPPAVADFLVGRSITGHEFINSHAVHIVHDDGSLAVVPAEHPLYPFFSVYHETFDTFTLSADTQRFYAFGNDVGWETIESWSSATGTYLGQVGIDPHQVVPTGLTPGYGVVGVHTRTNYPAFGGDLLYSTPWALGQYSLVIKPVVQIINTSSHQLVEQIVPPSSVTFIYDFALGPGTLGPKSRVYLNTEDGMFVFNETTFAGQIGIDPNTLQPIYDNSHFQLDSPTPLLTSLSATASFDIGPNDGYLYVLDGSGSASSIKRYDTTTGALVDTFLTFAQYNYGGVAGEHLKFGPDGGLYFLTTVNNHCFISRFDPASGQRTADYSVGAGPMSNFYVLPVPEPHLAAQLLIGAVFLVSRRRLC